MHCLQHSSRSLRGPQAGRTTHAVLVQCSFSFANSERANRPTGRRNRHVEKKQEDQLRGVAQGLCNFNGKQLQAVAHLLSEEHIKQIRIGMDIPPTNQGRKRQVGLVLRLIRSDLSDSALSKLSEAVQQANRYNQPYSDSDVEQQLDVWVEALTANDQAVTAELFELLTERQQDVQQLRTWVRQLQQHQQEQQQQQQEQQLQQQQQQQEQQDLQEGPGALEGVEQDVQQLMQQLSQPVQQGGSSKGGKAGKSPGVLARRSIRRMLKPLAMEGS